MDAWESMPYPQPDTIQELQSAVKRDLLSPEDLEAVQEAIVARGSRLLVGNIPEVGSRL
jgi:hypothetical protein